ncbi:MAG: response regulator, partial [Planctomycetaceae bacterium]|nr:response regulator [Planctomycetaceae bacterium]
DLILLDERLGSLSGTRYLAQIRRAFPRARVFIVSADPDALERGLSDGADGVARKPVPLQRLVETIETVLARPSS